MKKVDRKKNNSPSIKFSWVLTLILVAMGVSCDNDDEMEPWELEIAELKAAVERFENIEVAKAEGYDVDVTGYRTGMGHHYLKATLLDGTFEVTKPEVLLYAPNDSGGMDFVAVEYATPIEDLDNPPPAPKGFTGNHDVWEINTEFSLWTLHAWVVMDNAEGIFAPRNPKLP